MGKPRKSCKCALCTVDDASYILTTYPTWAQDVSVWEKCHCRVHNNGLWCDQLCNNITKVQQARLLASLSCVRFAKRPLVAQKKIQKIYACLHVSIVRLVQSTTLVSSLVATVPLANLRSSQSALFPYQASISICRIVHVPALSSRKSLGFTSVLPDDNDRNFRNTQPWMNKNLLWMCLILRRAPSFVAASRAVLLSALACTRNDSPITFRIVLCENQLGWHCTKNIHSDDASRLHQSICWSAWLLAFRDRWSTRILIHQTCTKMIHMEFRTNVGKESNRWVGLWILREQIQRNESQMEWQMTLMKTVIIGANLSVCPCTVSTNPLLW